MKYLTHSVEETEALAAQLAKTCQPGTIIALHGNLGCGKTAFSRGFAKALGIHEAVTSPTFTIVQEYIKPDQKPFYHLDLYRISNEDEAIAFGIDEYILNPQGISLIEWPERIEELLTPQTIHIYMSHVDENSRQIYIDKPEVNP